MSALFFCGGCVCPRRSLSSSYWPLVLYCSSAVARSSCHIDGVCHLLLGRQACVVPQMCWMTLSSSSGPSGLRCSKALLDDNVIFFWAIRPALLLSSSGSDGEGFMCLDGFGWIHEAPLCVALVHSWSLFVSGFLQRFACIDAALSGVFTAGDHGGLWTLVVGCGKAYFTCCICCNKQKQNKQTKKNISNIPPFDTWFLTMCHITKVRAKIK